MRSLQHSRNHWEGVMYMGNDSFEDSGSAPYMNPFSVDNLRRMLSANDYGAVGVEQPFMTRGECEQKSREVSAEDIAFATSCGIDLMK
jgi:hypothetical protein